VAKGCELVLRKFISGKILSRWFSFIQPIVPLNILTPPEVEMRQTEITIIDIGLK
jgi:hypothetical protein